MITIIIFFCVMILILGLIVEKSVVNPLSMFYGLWAVIIFLSSLEAYGLFKTSSTIYKYILIGLISFFIGYLLTRIIQQEYTYKGTNSISKISSGRIEVNLPVVYFLSILSILFYVKEVSLVLNHLISGGSLANIREMAQNTDSILHSNKSGLENALKILIITPFTAALQPIVATDLLLNDKKNKKLFYLNLIIILLRVLSDGSRTLVVYFAISLIVTFFISDKSKKKVGILRYLGFALGIVSIFLIIIFITSSRSGENGLRFAYYYFSMQPIMFEKWAYLVESSGFKGFGIGALNGFIFALFYVLNNMFNIPYPSMWREAYQFIEGTGTNWQTITSYGTSANSFVSAFWVLFLDGRLIGMVIGMLAYGALSAITFKKAKSTKNIKSVSIYIFIYIGLFYTFVRLQFANIYYDLSLVYLMFILFKKRGFTDEKR